MRRIIIMSAIIGILCSACERDVPCTPSGEIMFSLGGDGINFDIETKATIVTSVDTIWWEANNTNKVVHKVDRYAVNGGVVNTGKYWPAAGDSYSYKVANQPFETVSGCMHIDCSKDIDIVAGKAYNVTNNNTEVVLKHVLSRTGTLTLNPPSGYTVSDVKWTIRSGNAHSGRKGQYYVGNNWGTIEQMNTPMEITSESDLFFIPGGYKVKVTFTLNKGTYVKTFNKEADVTFSEGMIMNITGNISGGGAMEVVMTTPVADWQACEIKPIFKDCDE